eukprot:COSAG01_NODE_27137_length_693_cov_1.126263_1_plen_148_part_00
MMEERLLLKPDTRQSAAAAHSPHWVLVHLTCLAVQVIFGTGAVIGKLGVSSANPVLFIGIRDASSGPLLMVGSLLTSRSLRDSGVSPGDVPRLLAAGLCLYIGQAGFLVGEKLSSAVIGSAWQPVQPIMTAVLASCLGWEPFTVWRL